MNVDWEKYVKVSDIHPGMTFDPDSVRGLIGDVEPEKYGFVLMSLASSLEKFIAASGRNLTVTVTGGSLNVLTHLQASAYHSRRFEQNLRGMMRHTRRLSNVNQQEFFS